MIATQGTAQRVAYQAFLGVKETLVPALPIYAYTAPTVGGFIYGDTTLPSRTAQAFTSDGTLFDVDAASVPQADLDYILQNITTAK
jgi:hypothetical protein